MRRPSLRGTDLARMRYNPPGKYPLDLEVLTISELMRRAAPEQLGTAHRLDFVALIAVTRGRCRHMVDFVPYDCRAGSWLVIRPGQVHRYDVTSQWNGQQVVFRPEFLLPLQQSAAPLEASVYANLEGLPTHTRLIRAEHQAALVYAKQMGIDATTLEPEALRHPLLRHQLYALVLRVLAAHQRAVPQREAAPVHAQRFKRFRQAVERDLATTHKVSDYARHLGCSEKNLTRATLAVTGVSAKAYLSQRIALEAKRLLAHTALPIATIAAQIGFEEPTNFVKFFKREAGCAPGEFRHRSVRR